MSGTKQPTSNNVRLELEVRGQYRLNKLSNPVAQTSDFQYNQTPNPDLKQTREPWNTQDAMIGYQVNEYPAIPGPAAGAYYWNSNIGPAGDWAIWQDLNYKAPGLVATSEGMVAKPGERWSAAFQARFLDPAWTNSLQGGEWKVALGAYNGETYLSDVSSVQFILPSSYDAGWNGAAKATAYVGLTPANTTNVRWRVYNITDHPAGGSTRLTLEMRKGFSVKREFVTVSGWTGTNMELSPRVATWGYGPTVFEAKPTVTTGNLVKSTNVTGLVAGNFAGGAVDFVSTAGATLRVGIEFINASNAVLSTAWSSVVTGTTFKQRPSVAAVIPANATQARLVLEPSANKLFQWDAAVLIMDATSLTIAQGSGFKETAGAAVTNKIINPSGATGTNGWTQASTTTLQLTAEQGGIRGNFEAYLNEDSRHDPALPLLVTSNVFDVTPAYFVGGQATLRGKGAARFRWKWMDAVNTFMSYSEWSAVFYFNGDRTGFADTLVVPANVFRASLEIQYGQAVAMWDGPYQTFDPKDMFIFTGVSALVGQTMGSVTGTPNSDTVTWLNLFNQSTSISIRRGELDPGILTAEIADSTLDPNVNLSVRPDAKVRCMVLKNDGTTWAPIFTGELRDIQVTYPYKKRARVTLEAVDNIRTLGNEYVNFGVPTLGALTHVMTGSDVPWSITSADATTNTKVNGETTTRLDQIILTRDTQKGFAFVNKANTLIIRDRATQTALANKVFFSDLSYTGDATWNSYTPSGIEVKNSATDVINAMVVTVLTWSGTATVKTESALFTNGTSINEWGRQQKDVVINGGTGAPTATTWATDVMALHANPIPTVNTLSFPVNDDRSWDHGIDLELYDNVRVQYSPIALDRQYAVRSINHSITPGKWTCDVAFRSGSGLAQLLEVRL